MVDGLRGLAALAVVLFHANGVWWVALPEEHYHYALTLSSLGINGVSVFFVLSGFVIALSVGQKGVSGRFVRRFALRRSVRLDPPYLVAIALSLMLVGARYFLGGGEQGQQPVTLPQVIAHLFYLQDILGFEQLSPVFWTLCLEVQLYLGYVLMLWLAHSVVGGRADEISPQQTRAALIAVAVAFALSFARPMGLLGESTVWFGPHLYKFLLGVITLYAVRGIIRYRWAVGVLLATTLCYAVRWTVDDAAPRTDLDSLGFTIATASLLLLAGHTGALHRWLSWKPLLWLGMISYSLYLAHVPIIDVIVSIQGRLAADSPSAGVAAFAFAAAASVAGAAVMWWLVERPTLALASRIKSRPKASGRRMWVSPAIDRPQAEVASVQ